MGSLIYFSPSLRPQLRSFSILRATDIGTIVVGFTTLLSLDIPITTTLVRVGFTCSCSRGAGAQVGGRFRLRIDGVVQAGVVTATDVMGSGDLQSASFEVTLPIVPADVRRFRLDFAQISAAGTVFQIFPITRPTTDHASLVVQEEVA